MQTVKLYQFYHHLLTLENHLLPNNGIILNTFNGIKGKFWGSHSIKSEMCDTNGNSVQKTQLKIKLLWGNNTNINFGAARCHGKNSVLTVPWSRHVSAIDLVHT